MNELERFAVEYIAGVYGVGVRELTIGQIADFLSKEKESNKELLPDKKERSKERINLQEITENKETDIYRQNPSKSIKIEQNPSNTLVWRSEFEGLWKKYPRKQGKKDALRHYCSARKQGWSFEEVSDGLDRYCDYIKRNRITENYIKQGSAWFCQWSWDDDYSGDFSNGRGFRQSLSDERALQIAEEVLHGR